MKSLVVLLLSLFVLSINILRAQDSLIIKKGTVTDSLIDPITGSKFSVYLPTEYNKNKKWPLLIGLESSVKSSSVTYIFKEAAEEYGYIVAILSIDQNNTFDQSSKQFVEFINTITSFFSVQDDAVYTVGIGNDADLSSLMPVLYPDYFAGTIAINNSVIYDETFKPKKNFFYYGIAHTGRVEFRHFIWIKNFLTERAIPAEVVFYNTQSEIPSARVMKQVLSKFSLQAMLKGRRALDSLWIQKELKEDLLLVNDFFEKEEYLKAKQKIIQIKQNYYGYYPKDSIQEIESKILSSRNFKKEETEFFSALNHEDLLTNNYMNLLKKDIENVDYESLSWWEDEIKKLNEIHKNGDKYVKDMVFRVKIFIKNVLKDYKEELKNSKIDSKIFLNILSVIIDQKDFDSYIDIIKLSVLDGDYETTLYYLEKLLNNGYNDYERLYQIEGTLGIRITKEYNDIIKKYFGRSKYQVYH